VVRSCESGAITCEQFEWAFPFLHIPGRHCIS
jgi:hypothetical protein